MGYRITSFLRPEWIVLSLNGHTKKNILTEIAQHMAAQVAGLDSNQLFQLLEDREQRASTGADNGLAIPHAVIPGIEHLMVFLARSSEGVPFGALDNRPSHIFFTVVSPPPIIQAGPDSPSYLHIIGSICRLMRAPHLRDKLLQANSPNEMYELLCQEESSRPPA